MQNHFDQYLKENGAKTIDQYRPPSLHGVEENLTPKQNEKQEMEDKTEIIAKKNKVLKSSENTESKDENDAPTITYLDQGEAFTSSSSSGALLF